MNYQEVQSFLKDNAIEWETKKDINKIGHITINGFYVSVIIEEDEDYDFTECRGTFGTVWKPGCIKNPCAKYDKNIYEYFYPVITFKEHYDSLKKMGMSDSEARREAMFYVKDDLLCAAEPFEQGLYAILVKVSVRKKGVELGSAVTGMECKNWSWERNNPKWVEYMIAQEKEIRSAIEEKMYEALEEAEKKLAELVKG